MMPTGMAIIEDIYEPEERSIRCTSFPNLPCTAHGYPFARGIATECIYGVGDPDLIGTMRARRSSQLLLWLASICGFQ